MKNAKFELNTEGRDFFVGDLHGEYETFMQALDKVEFDTTTDRMFSVGDLGDRGPDSVKCFELLDYDWFHAVRGNHEDFLLGSHRYSIWMMNGGNWANTISPQELVEIQELVKQKMHRTMTIKTPLGTIGVVHAESADDWKHNSELTEEINTWSRSKIRSGNATFVSNVDRVVVGHTVLKEPAVLGNTIYIDTGAVFGHDLTLIDSIQVFNNDFLVIEGRKPKKLTSKEELAVSLLGL